MLYDDFILITYYKIYMAVD